MDELQRIREELKESREFVKRSKLRFNEMTALSLDIGEQNKKMKEALFAITKSNGLGEAKMIAKSILTEIRTDE